MEKVAIYMSIFVLIPLSPLFFMQLNRLRMSSRITMLPKSEAIFLLTTTLLVPIPSPFSNPPNSSSLKSRKQPNGFGTDVNESVMSVLLAMPKIIP